MDSLTRAPSGFHALQMESLIGHFFSKYDVPEPGTVEKITDTRNLSFPN